MVSTPSVDSCRARVFHSSGTRISDFYLEKMYLLFKPPHLCHLVTSATGPNGLKEKRSKKIYLCSTKNQDQYKLPQHAHAYAHLE